MNVAEAAPRLRRPRLGRRSFRWSPALLVGLVLVLGPLALSVALRLLVDAKDLQVFAFDPALRPSGAHPLGTDLTGRDLLTMTVHSTPPTLEIGLIAGVVGTVVGTVAGLVSGYFRGPADTVVRGAVDIMLGIPALAVLIVIASLVGSVSLVQMALILAVFSWPFPARAIRGQMLTLREQPFVLMSKLSNRTSGGIMFLEILPNILPYIMATFVGTVSGSLLVAIGLQLLGLGPPDEPTLGLMLQLALSNGALSQGMWWWWTPPTVILILLFLGLFLVSVAVDEIANPRLKGAERRG